MPHELLIKVMVPWVLAYIPFFVSEYMLQKKHRASVTCQGFTPRCLVPEPKIPVSNPGDLRCLTEMLDKGIYTITVYPKGGRGFRVWGYEQTFKEAERKVLANHSDLFEYYYRYAVIEQVMPGVPAWDHPKGRTAWYSADYDETGALTVTPCECPEGYQEHRCFSMG